VPVNGSKVRERVGASARDQVAFSVSDDVDCATVAGRAIVHRTGAVRDQLTSRVRDRLLDGAPWAAEMLDREIEAGLDKSQRVIITVLPDQVRLVQPLG